MHCQFNCDNQIYIALHETQALVLICASFHLICSTITFAAFLPHVASDPLEPVFDSSVDARLVQKSAIFPVREDLP